MKRYCSPLTCSLFLSSLLAARPESTHQRRYEGLFATEKRVSRYRISCASSFFKVRTERFSSLQDLQFLIQYIFPIYSEGAHVSPHKNTLNEHGQGPPLEEKTYPMTAVIAVPMHRLPDPLHSREVTMRYFLLILY